MDRFNMTKNGRFLIIDCEVHSVRGRHYIRAYISGGESMIHPKMFGGMEAALRAANRVRDHGDIDPMLWWTKEEFEHRIEQANYF